MPNLADRYQLAEIIYSDAQVVAYCAQDQLLNRTVTVELLQSGQPDQPQRAGQLIDKAHQAALSSLPHVAALYDQHAVDGRPFLVLEEPIGPALGEIVPLPPEQAVAVVRQVGETLRAALLRQQPLPAINPTTVRIGADSRVQILDLGLEQPPAQPAVALQLLGQLLSAGLGGANDRLSAPLQRIADDAIRGQYRSIGDLVAALEQIEQRATQPTTVLQRVPPTVVVEQQPPALERGSQTAILETVQPIEQPILAPERPARRWGLWAALGLGLLALLAVGALLLRPNDRATQPPAPPAAGTSPTTGAASPAASPANGTLFVVSTNNGQALIVRSGPGRSFSRITSIPDGATVEVLEGPQAADGFNWVRIRTANVEGWCASEALRRR